MHCQEFVVASTFVLFTVVIARDANGGKCDCFQTNGSTGTYFAHHRFFDYRNIPSSLTSNPPVLHGTSETKHANDTSAFFTGESWTAYWATQNWDNSESINTTGSDATVLMVNSPNNVYIGMSSSKNPSNEINKVTFLYRI